MLVKIDYIDGTYDSFDDIITFRDDGNFLKLLGKFNVIVAMINLSLAKTIRFF